MLSENERIQHIENFDTQKAIAAVQNSGHAAILGLNLATSAILAIDLHKTCNKPIIALAANDKILEQFRNNLQFFDNSGNSILDIPAIENSPYNGIAPNKRLVAQRIGACHSLLTKSQAFITLSILSLAKRCMPISTFKENTLSLEIGCEINLDTFKTNLLQLGYSSETEVDIPGTFAIRGGVIDIYSPAHENPIRIELFGDEIDEIKSFDTESQKSIAQLQNCTILPAAEELLTPECLRQADKTLIEIADALEVPTKILKNNREKLAEAVHFWGINSLFPAFYEKTEMMADYLPKEAVYLWLEPDLCIDTLRQYHALLQKQYQHCIDENNLVSKPDDIFIETDAIIANLNAQKTLYAGLSIETQMDLGSPIRLDTIDNQDIIQWRKSNAAENTTRNDTLLKFITDQFLEWNNIYGEIAIVAHSRGARDRIEHILKSASIPTQTIDGHFNLTHQFTPAEKITLYLGDLSCGCRIPSFATAIITEEELFGTRQKRKKQTKSQDAHIISSFRDLKAGDYIVHEEHGIGQYLGLVTLEVAGIKGDFLHIAYAGDDKLYIPVQRLKSVQKYAGAEQPRHIDKLGGGTWERTKERVRQEIQKLAINLLELYAQRQSQNGFAFSERDPYYEAFEASFPFEETPDQEKAINAILDDMHKKQPMERLVCGDVGFGKTEVAMRAAMRAVLDTKQVAVLVPTTILAEQHFETFLQRFNGYPVRIESLNRFRKPKEVKTILADLAEGKVDILIGTHRLLSKDVQFKDLGLLIIDEEHRFGVTHKEKIKAMATNIDCLTMTATPIPRTFQMCLGGLKDLSVIATPPEDRLAIHTTVAKYSENLITQAIEQELRRGGQVYFLHNRVEELPAMYDMLHRCVPSAKIGIAHGQMDEKALENAMFDFIHRKTDVLLCTTIIESGLDIPCANCLIVNHADRFGLAQLYQIRGRVGRSSTRAYCYLLVQNKKITDIARERLEAIERLTELGSGLEIAHLDMEMRGCGNLLGAEQSGNICAVGLEMYAELMQEAVLSLQGQPVPNHLEPDVNLPFSAYLPDDYINDLQLRLVFYKRLASAENADALYEVFGEIVDRFGNPPKEVLALRDTFELKLLLAQLGLKSLDANYTSIIIDVSTSKVLDPNKILDMILNDKRRYSLRQDLKLIRYLTKEESNALVETTAMYLDSLKKFCYQNECR